MDFLNKGEKKPAPKQETPQQNSNPFENKQATDPSMPAAQDQSATQAPGVNLESQFNLYTVKSGDSLSKISSRIYGDPSQWRKIYEANQDILKDPDLIHPGQQLVIPR